MILSNEYDRQEIVKFLMLKQGRREGMETSCKGSYTIISSEPNEV